VVVVSYSGKEINAKLVYYGAGLSGKTTNLEAIYEAVPDTSRGKMVSMKTQSDRTLFFDLLPLDLGEIMGFKTRFLLYTVPGQVFYNATRKLVLKGADAIVFVADSEVGKMEENKESLANLRANLAEYGLTLDAIPWVIQYNKRDLPNVYSVDELNAELNPAKVPSFEAVASEGKGVFETFRGVSHLLMDKVTKDLRRSPGTSPRTPQPPAPEPHAPLPATPSAPPALARSTVAPPAPVQAIRREAQATPGAVASEPVRIDYGEEIDLPATNRDLSPPFVQPVTEPEAAPAAAPGSFRSMSLPLPASMSATATAPVAVSAPVTAASSVGTPEPDSFPNPEGSAQVRQIVVPVKLPPGARYEIVIKLQLDTTS
jgi:signal recognition particle receptor subunit beta